MASLELEVHVCLSGLGMGTIREREDHGSVLVCFDTNCSQTLRSVLLLAFRSEKKDTLFVSTA